MYKNPAVYIIDNNGRGMAVPLRRQTAVPDISKKAEACGLPAQIVDGSRILDVRRALDDAIIKARNDEPNVVEVKDIRWEAHYFGQNSDYRDDMDEVAYAKEHKDCVKIYEDYLVGKGVIDQAYIDRLTEELTKKMDEYVKRARQSEKPRFEDIYRKEYIMQRLRREGTCSENMCLSHAIAAAVSKKMEADPAVYLLGEDIINKGGGLSTYLDVPKKFPGRCFDMPIAELGFTHFANGMALAGLRPIVDLMFSDFTTIPSDAIINGAAKYRFNSLGKASVPAVYVMGNGARGFFGGYGSGCNHSQCSEAWFMNVPGIKMVMPYYPADALGLMRASIRENDPAIFLFYQGSSGVRGEVPEEDYIMPPMSSI